MYRPNVAVVEVIELRECEPRKRLNATLKYVEKSIYSLGNSEGGKAQHNPCNAGQSGGYYVVKADRILCE